MENRVHELKSLWSECSSQLRLLSETARDEALQKFESEDGCNECRGRGWIVTWDTLDSMSGGLAEYGSCPENECTDMTREASGYHPTNSQYDRNRGSTWSPAYSPEIQELHSRLEQAKSKLENDIRDEERRWMPAAGKVVKVVQSSRGRKARRVPVGVVGYVLKLVTNDWGTTKAIVRDAEGKEWWPTVTQLAVTDPAPDNKAWAAIDRKKRDSSGYPVVATVLKKTPRASLVRTTTSKEFWIPYSQVAELRNVNLRSTASIVLPMWIAKKNNLVGEG